MNSHNCHCQDDYRARLSGWAQASGSPESLARTHRFAWRNALAGLASPAVRLHQLRNLRTHLMHEALDDLDGCKDA